MPVGQRSRGRRAAGRSPRTIGIRSSRLALVLVRPDRAPTGDEPVARPQLVQQGADHQVAGCRAIRSSSGGPARRRGRRVRRAGGRGRRRGRRLDDPVGVEGGGVVPAAVVAVLVVGQRVRRARRRASSQNRSSAPAVVDLRRARSRSRSRAAVGADRPQRPAVDGRLDEVVEDLGVGDRVGQRAGTRPGGRRAPGTGPGPASGRRAPGRGR